MAKSDSDSNGLRQDQPECAPCGAVGGTNERCWSPSWHCMVQMIQVTPDRSHRIVKANIRFHLSGRTGGVKSSFFGSKLTVLGGINPPTVQTTERINMPQCRESSGQHEVSIYSNSVLLLRGK